MTVECSAVSPLSMSALVHNSQPGQVVKLMGVGGIAYTSPSLRATSAVFQAASIPAESIPRQTVFPRRSQTVECWVDISVDTRTGRFL